MKKRILAVFLSLCMVFSMLTAPPASAEGDYPYARDWAYYRAQRVFLVEQEEDLRMLATIVNSGNDLFGYTFLQTADIVLTGEFTPIGRNLNNADTEKLSTVFMGTYDGQYHTVSNLRINLSSQNGVGLFGACYGATLQNIGIESGSVTGANRAGGIAGYADSCKILNCYNKADIRIVTGADGVGGIAGVARNSAVMIGCVNFGTVTGVSEGAGGIAGWGQGNATLHGCYNGGSVTVTDPRVGGTNAITDALCRNNASASLDYSDNYYLVGSCSNNSWKATVLDKEDMGEVAWLVNHAQGTDSRAFTVDGGELHFSDDSLNGITCVKQLLYRGGVLFSKETQYCAAGGVYTVPETVAGYRVLNAGDLRPGDTVPVGTEELELALELEGAFPSVTDVALYPDETVFTVSTAEELAALSALVGGGNTFAGKRVCVTQDLDFAGINAWRPIGGLLCAFSGDFDGQYHHFKNINFQFSTTDTRGEPGLFGRVTGGTLENIVLDEGSVIGSYATARSYSGAVLCYTLNGGTVRSIENHLSLTLLDGTATTSPYAGLVSTAQNGAVIENAVSDGGITVPDAVRQGFIYGIAGYVNGGTVRNCISAVQINGTTPAPIAYRGGESCYQVGDTLAAADYSSAHTAYLLNTVSEREENAGLWTAGPHLAPAQAVYRVDAVLLDEDGEQLGEEVLYLSRGEGVAFPAPPGYEVLYGVCNGAKVENGWQMPARDLVLYLYYQRESYPVTFELNGGKLLQEQLSAHTAGKSEALPTGDLLERAGYAFVGWYDNKELTGELFRQIPADLCGPVTYYAAWAVPTEISTPEQLCALSDLSGCYILTADIDLTGFVFRPIGTLAEPFTGTFDGNGYIISGLNLQSSEEYQGLFGYSLGLICNVTLAGDCTVSGSSFAGGIAGFNGGVIADCISRAQVTVRAAEKPQYKIMSQNLWVTGSKDAFRLEAMAERMLREQPDLIGMQEANTAWVNYLTEQLTDYTVIYQSRLPSDSEGTPLAYRNDRFEELDHGTFWLSSTPDEPRIATEWGAGYARICTWVILRDREDGALLALYNTHLDVLGSNSAYARVMGAELVKSRMFQTLAQYPDIMLFSTGDYNDIEGSPAYRILTADGLGDARYLAKKSTTDNTFSNDMTDNWAGGSRRIDFIIGYQQNV